MQLTVRFQDLYKLLYTKLLLIVVQNVWIFKTIDHLCTFTYKTLVRFKVLFLKSFIFIFL